MYRAELGKHWCDSANISCLGWDHSFHENSTRPLELCSKWSSDFKQGKLWFLQPRRHKFRQYMLTLLQRSCDNWRLTLRKIVWRLYEASSFNSCRTISPCQISQPLSVSALLQKKLPLEGTPNPMRTRLHLWKWHDDCFCYIYVLGRDRLWSGYMSIQLGLYKTRSPPKRCTSSAIFRFCSVSPGSSFPPLNWLSSHVPPPLSSKFNAAL